MSPRTITALVLPAHVKRSPLAPAGTAEQQRPSRPIPSWRGWQRNCRVGNHTGLLWGSSIQTIRHGLVDVRQSRIDWLWGLKTTSRSRRDLVSGLETSARREPHDLRAARYGQTLSR